MPPVAPQEAAVLPRLICYQQTYFTNNGSEYVSLRPICRAGSADLTHLILAAIHLNEDPEHITLNDDHHDHPRFAELWREAAELQVLGVKVMGMLGGAAPGSFRRLDGDEAQFNRYYGPFRDMISRHALDGLDLDVEEEMSLAGVIRLIDRLKQDFGDRFIITLAPVATALVPGLRHLSGFDYFALERARGSKISWYNTQFYNGWGMMDSTAAYDMIIAQGWPPEKVVVGQLTNPRNGSQGYVPLETTATIIGLLLQKYPKFGGMFGWEYYNALPGGTQRPWDWVRAITMIFAMKRLYDIANDPSLRRY